MLKEENTYFSGLIKAIIVILFYLFAYSYPYEVLTTIGINLNKMSLGYKAICLTIYEVLILAVVIYAYKNELIPKLKDFKNNFKEYMHKYFKFWYLILLLMFVSNSIIVNFTANETSTNQEIIVESLKKAPIYILITTILVAPILEELIFRFCIKKIIPKPSIIYIIVSGIVFGSMHVLLTMTDITDLLFIIPYSIPGVIFAYLYNKTDNIFIPISIHFTHNTVLMLLEVILSLI